MTELEWMEIFSDNLVSLMEETGHDQMTLSEATGLSQGTISKYINKKQMAGAKAIINLSYELDCNIEDLIDFGERIE